MRQRCKSSSDIELWSASDADMEMRKVKVNELLDKRKDLFTRRWNPRPIWALVERVQDDVNRLRMGTLEHILETLYHNFIAGLL